MSLTNNTDGFKISASTTEPAINESISLLENKLYYTGFIKNLETVDIIEFLQNGAYTGTFNISPSGSGPAYRLRGWIMAKLDVKFRDDVKKQVYSEDLNATYADPQPVRPEDSKGDSFGDVEAGRVRELSIGNIDITVKQSRTMEVIIDMPVTESAVGYTTTVMTAFELMAKQVYQTRAYHYYDTQFSGALARYYADNGGTIGDDPSLYTEGHTIIDTGDIELGETRTQADASLAHKALTNSMNRLKSLINEFHTGINAADLAIVMTIEFYQVVREHILATELSARIFTNGARELGEINGVTVFEDPKIDRNHYQDSRYAQTVAGGSGALVSPNIGKIDFITCVKGQTQAPLSWNVAFANNSHRAISVQIIGQEFWYDAAIIDSGLAIAGCSDIQGSVASTGFNVTLNSKFDRTKRMTRKARAKIKKATNKLGLTEAPKKGEYTVAPNKSTNDFKADGKSGSGFDAKTLTKDEVKDFKKEQKAL